ncbi:helix-turn-helix transcriptional regulator [Vibrio sp. 99-8-1]|uniref:helix-turn-helix domain-containing protein n=1 Tax=Vibrio sp. 99-8-1 TaxID=2607602 RepID=UPI0014935E0D|nr:helix-turn-helix transcriptional regulator [Vibrio sp. 99-8-1]NOI65212.1 helix-turn-helix transcriptional regulator [Vibrio sp. 99-8-1]
MSFSQRLKELIGEESVSGFARRVDMSEALIRKYLKGSEPSLSKANQIAMKANCSLEWLATGCGYLYRQVEVVDMPAYLMAHEAVLNRNIPEQEQSQHRLVISAYQYLRAHKKADGYLDKQGMMAFIHRHQG